MLRAFSIVVVSFFVAACATTKDVYLADGSLGHNITCNGHHQNFSSCLEMAGEVCRSRGYVVINPRGEAIPYDTASGAYTADAVAAYGGIQTQMGPIVTRSLFVKCK